MEQGGEDAMEEEADRAMKELLEAEVKTSAAANAVSEHLEAEKKDAAAASQKEKTCKERRRRVEDGEDDIKNAEEQCYKQKDTKTTKAKSESEKKKFENVAAVPVVAGLKDKVEERGEQEEEMRQRSAERKVAERRPLVAALLWRQQKCQKKHQHQQKACRELRQQQQGQGPVTRISICQ
jgi:inhibitor of KinA sporulation pathway (predicted exonuclease)